MTPRYDTLIDLVNRVRELRIERTSNPEKPVRLNCPSSQVPRILSGIRDVLDEIESTGAYQVTDRERVLERENAAMTRSLKALFVFIREYGLDEEEAKRVAKEAADPGERAKSYRFKPKKQKSRKKDKQRVRLEVGPPTQTGRGVIDQGYKLREVADRMGGAMVRASPATETRNVDAIYQARADREQRDENKPELQPFKRM